MILDAGFLISVDRGDEAARAFVAAASRQGTKLRTTHPVVGQVWRNGGRQVRLAKFLKGFEALPMDDGKLAGQLLAASGTDDVVDAHLVALALRTGDSVLTGDVGDLTRVATAIGTSAPVIHGWP